MSYYRSGDFYGSGGYYRRPRGDLWDILKGAGGILASAATGPIGMAFAHGGFLGETAQKYAQLSIAGAQGFMSGGPAGALQGVLPGVASLFSSAQPTVSLKRDLGGQGSPLSPENYPLVRRGRRMRSRVQVLRSYAPEQQSILTSANPPSSVTYHGPTPAPVQLLLPSSSAAPEEAREIFRRPAIVAGGRLESGEDFYSRFR